MVLLRDFVATQLQLNEKKLNQLRNGAKKHGLTIRDRSEDDPTARFLLELQRLVGRTRWTKGQLPSPGEAAKQLEAHRQELSKLESAILPWVKSSLSGQESKTSTSHARTGQVKNDQDIDWKSVVQMVAINQAEDVGFNTLAAIVTTSDGVHSTLTSEHTKYNFETTSRFNSNEIVQFDFRSLDEEAAPMPTAKPENNLPKRLCKHLSFGEEEDRYFKIDSAHESTFRWIFRGSSNPSHVQFRQWLEHGQGLFWINGKAGSGKSTLMKYIHQQQGILRNLLGYWGGARELVIASFFFWHAGTTLQKSFEGVLRSLLNQALAIRPSLIPVVFPKLCNNLLTMHNQSVPNPTNDELHRGLFSLLDHLPNDIVLFVMIDGVDEYTGDHLKFAKLLVEVAKHPQVKVLASSRPEPECHYVFNEHPTLRLQDLTHDDICSYIESELLNESLFVQMSQFEPGFAEEVESALVEKCSGVFMWIVLVIRQLIRGLIHFEDRQSLMATIDEIPDDLEQLYHQMLSRMNAKHREEGYSLLRLMNRAQAVQNSRLTALQLTLAESHLRNLSSKKLMPILDINVSNETVCISMMSGRLRSRCCGLIEIQDQGVRGKLNEPLAIFLHRTVYDYLRNPSIWDVLVQADDLKAGLLDRSHLLAAASLHWYSQREKPSYRDTMHKPYFANSALFAFELAKSGDSSMDEFFVQLDREFRAVAPPFTYFYVWNGVSKSCSPAAYLSTAEPTAATFAANVGWLSLMKHFVRFSEASHDVSQQYLIELLDAASQLHEADPRYDACVASIETLLTAGIDPNKVVLRTGRCKVTVLPTVKGLEPCHHRCTAWTHWFEGPCYAERIKNGRYHVKVLCLLIEAGARFDRELEKANAVQQDTLEMIDLLLASSSASSSEDLLTKAQKLLEMLFTRHSSLNNVFCNDLVARTARNARKTRKATETRHTPKIDLCTIKSTPSLLENAVEVERQVEPVSMETSPLRATQALALLQGQYQRHTKNRAN